MVVYENRGENLTYLKTPTYDGKPSSDSWGHPIPISTTLSGSEHAQQKTAAERAAAQQSCSRPKSTLSRVSAFLTFSELQSNASFYKLKTYFLWLCSLLFKNFIRAPANMCTYYKVILY